MPLKKTITERNEEEEEGKKGGLPASAMVVVERAEKSGSGSAEEGFLLLVTSDGSIHFSMASLYPQSDSSPPNFHKQLSGTSIALVCVFFCCFIGIVYLSAKPPRPSRVLHTTTAAQLTARQRRPRLREIWLDKHLDGTVLNWRVSHSLLHLATQL